jgi:hypothetical protein
MRSEEGTTKLKLAVVAVKVVVVVVVVQGCLYPPAVLLR